MPIGDYEPKWCTNCRGELTGGCHVCNQKFYTLDPLNGTVPFVNPPPYGAPPIKYVVGPPQTYQPIPEPGPTQRERIVVQLLAGLIGAGMDDGAAINKAFDLADIVMKRLNSL